VAVVACLEGGDLLAGRSPSFTARWIVPGVNQTTSPGRSGLSEKPDAVSVCTRPAPATTT
jgi:hypothetical protein